MKKKIVFGYLAYPFAIASYFRHALEKRSDVELFTVGPYTGDFIPWGNGMRIDMKYVKPVNLPLPPSITNPSWKMIEDKLPWNPDLVLAVDAGFYFRGLFDARFPYAVVATDPHVLNYDEQRRSSTHFFNMQRYYMKDGDIHLPYCCSPDHHYVMNEIETKFDASLIGLHYSQRDALVAGLRSSGLKVFYSLGLIYDEYRLANNQAVIGLNWSSLADINARTFEIMAMKQVPLINRLPNLDELGFEEGRHYYGFDTVEEAVAQAKRILSNPEEAQAVANNAYQLVHENHTYEKRIQQIFDTVGL